MLSWIVACIAAAGAVAGFAFGAARARALADASREVEALRTELGAARGRVEKRSDADRRRDEELAELRRRLEKTKKRASQARDDERLESSRIHDLEEKLRLAQADARGMRGELQRAEAEVARLREAPRPKAPAPPPPPAPVPAAPEAPRDESLVRRAEEAEGRALALEEQLVAARVDAERQRRKVAAQDRLYVALRGELGAKKDRLRAQQEELERLRALRLVLAEDLAEPVQVVEAPTAGEGSP